ncbi:MAG TPA: alpha/beta hydrolase [Actinomycetota bacterium]|nr:alpha/beta hydrolase [Actinomycetota bacterium]
MTTNDLGFHYRFEPKPGAGRTLVLLHGTGADENDLIPLGLTLDPKAHLLSPRGKVLENGMARFFRRLAEGVFDVEDLKARTHELADFVEAAAQTHDLAGTQLVAVGFSNGANIAASTLLLRPTLFRAAVLLRPMVPFEPAEPPDLTDVDVFVGAGRSDPLIDPASTERLVEMLTACGASVEVLWNPGGHQLAPPEVHAATKWLAGL